MSNPDPSINPVSRTFMDLSEEPSVEAAKPAVGGHNALSPMDPDNPQNWPLRKKVYASFVAASFTFAVYVYPLLSVVGWIALLRTIPRRRIL